VKKVGCTENEEQRDGDRTVFRSDNGEYLGTKFEC
jgi:hypothetical protein